MYVLYHDDAQGSKIKGTLAMLAWDTRWHAHARPVPPSAAVAKIDHEVVVCTWLCIRYNMYKLYLNGVPSPSQVMRKRHLLTIC